MPELVSQREYARRRGVSQPAVVKAIKTGRIKTVNGKIDPEQADREWAANTNGGQKMRKAAIAGGAPIDPGGSPAGLDRSQVDTTPGRMPGELGVNYSQQRAIHEGYRARLAKVDFEQKTGKLIDVDSVRVKWFNAARNARDMLLAVPERLAPLLAGESNQFECHRLLNEEIRRVCDAISSAKPT